MKMSAFWDMAQCSLDRYMDGWMERQMDRQTGRYLNRWMNERTEGGWMDE
jgi:hypothetical protein